VMIAGLPVAGAALRVVTAVVSDHDSRCRNEKRSECNRTAEAAHVAPTETTSAVHSASSILVFMDFPLSRSRHASPDARRP